MSTAGKLALKIFGSTNIKSFHSFSPGFTRKYKIVVFVPLNYTDELTFAMASAGAGIIGNYTVCSFRTKGTGTFMSGKSAKPAVGKKGKFEIVEEIRLEMLCSKDILENVLNTIYEIHPYEEPACEIYEVYVKESKNTGTIIGLELKKDFLISDVLKKINKKLDTAFLPAKQARKKIRKVIIDTSEGSTRIYPETRGKTLVIKKNKNIINIELS